MGGLPVLLERHEVQGHVPGRADVVIVGAGIIGLLTAIGLTRKGRQPLVVEAANVGSGQSGRNLGFIRSQGRDEPEVVLMKRAIELWEKLSHDFGPDLSFRLGGHLSLASNGTGANKILAWKEVARRHDIDFQERSERDLQRDYPWLAHGYTQAGRTPCDGQADPRTVIDCLRRHALDCGVVILEQTRVTSLDIAGNAVVGVGTSRGIVKSESVLLATGAWTRRLLAEIGIVLPTHAGVATMAATQPLAQISESTVWEVGRLGFRQDASGRVVFGLGGYVDVYVRWEDVRGALSVLPTYMANRHTMKIRLGRPLIEDAADIMWGRRLRPFGWTEFEPNVKHLKAGLAWLREMIPAIKPDLGLDATWTGLIDTTSDFLPAIGNAGVRGLLFVAGLSGHGFGLAPALAEGLVDIIQGKSIEDTPLVRFRPERLPGYSSAYHRSG
jgi:glycine/D-amino acid oxidase-like deaminating enzyme